MNLEAAIKHFSPKSLMISDSSCATASAALTGTDVMAALGMAQSRAELGFALFFAKHMKDRESREKAIRLLASVARLPGYQCIVAGTASADLVT